MNVGEQGFIRTPPPQVPGNPTEVIQLLQNQLADQQQYLTNMHAAFQGLQAQLAMGVGKGNGGKGNYGVDTKVLGRPETLDSEGKWQDWSIIMRAYASVTNADLGHSMETVESMGDTTDEERMVLNAALGENARNSSQQLYYMLVLLTRGESLNIIINAGIGEGLLAWKRLVARYEPAAKARLAGLLLMLMKWTFSGDLQARLELFERELRRWEHKAGEQMSDQIRMGIVLLNIEDGPIKDHLLMNSAEYKDWVSFKSDVIDIRRAKEASSGAAPMDIDGLTKGKGKGKGKTDKTKVQ